MSLSEAYGGKPTILTLSQFQEDMKRMGHNDKLVYDCKMNVDDDVTLADLIATIKNIVPEQNDPVHNQVVTLSETVQP
jgi:hypothetical protein